MRNITIAALTLLATTAFGQVTKNFSASANGSAMSATVYNSAQAAWQVVNPSSVPLPNPCTPAPANTQPKIVTASGSSVLFKQAMKDFVHPFDVGLTQLRMQICYSVVGNTLSNLQIIMQYKNLATGVVTDGPVVATIPSGNYIAVQTFLSAEVFVNPPLNSLMTSNMQNIEFGYRISAGAGPIFGNPAVVAVHKILPKLLFNATAMQNPIAPVATYTKLINFSSSTVSVLQNFNAPTNNETLSIEIRCGNNVYRPLIVRGPGSVSSPFQGGWSMQVINGASYCGGGGATPLVQGNTSMLRTRNTTTNVSTYSPNFTLL